MDKTELTEEQKQEAEELRLNWIRDFYQKANKYLATKGVIPQEVIASECRYLIPYFGLWKIVTVDKKKFWVLSGDLPTDHIPVGHAENAREALRTFSLNWQLKAQQILGTQTTDETQVKYANLLIHRAENMYKMFDDDDLWRE